MIRVLGSQPAGDVSHKPGGRLSLLSAMPAVSITPGSIINKALITEQLATSQGHFTQSVRFRHSSTNQSTVELNRNVSSRWRNVSGDGEGGADRRRYMRSVCSRGKGAACIGYICARVVHGSILCDPIQPNPSTD